MSGLLSAVQFLTRIPVPNASFRLESAVPWFPLVGLLLGAVLVGADWVLAGLGLAPLITSTVLVVLLLGLTGALHADGLMDACDALFAHATPARRLEIMRDPHVGAFGVVGIVCVVALKIGALEALPAAVRPQLLVLAPGLGRWSIVVLAAVFPYGRPAGLGKPLKDASTPRVLVLASLAPLGACALAGPVGLACGLLAALVAVALGSWLMRLLPGPTGDCYGAVCETVETIVWLAAAPLARALI
jgi:adenosylcobinamide-GDP ribazoletransferase